MNIAHQISVQSVTLSFTETPWRPTSRHLCLSLVRNRSWTSACLRLSLFRRHAMVGCQTKLLQHNVFLILRENKRAGRRTCHERGEAGPSHLGSHTSSFSTKSQLFQRFVRSRCETMHILHSTLQRLCCPDGRMFRNTVGL